MEPAARPVMDNRFIKICLEPGHLRARTGVGVGRERDDHPVAFINSHNIIDKRADGHSPDLAGQTAGPAADWVQTLKDQLQQSIRVRFRCPSGTGPDFMTLSGLNPLNRPAQSIEEDRPDR